VEHPADRRASALLVARVVLAVFVLAWLVGPSGLRAAVPIWLVFAVALGLVVQFFVGGLRPGPVREPDRGPQEIDRRRYGYGDADDDPDDDADEGDEPWVPDATEPRPRRSRRVLAAVGAIAALGLVLWLVEARTGWDSLDRDVRDRAAARFADEASRIAAKPVTIRCDESGRHVGVVQHADGAARVGGSVAYLTPERCLDLYRLAFEGDAGSSRTGRALAVLAHEAWHLRGVADEGTVECYALQSGVGLGRRFGLSEETARRLMRQQLAENLLRGRSSPEYRIPSECRDGGRLDLSPSVPGFP
jgi:hypothetical protein